MLVWYYLYTDDTQTHTHTHTHTHTYTHTEAYFISLVFLQNAETRLIKLIFRETVRVGENLITDSFLISTQTREIYEIIIELHWEEPFKNTKKSLVTKAENYKPSGVVRFELWLWERTACRCKNIDLWICSEVIYCESGTAELVYTTKSQGKEPTFLSCAVRM